MNREDIQMWATRAQLPQNYMTGEAMWLDRLEDFAALVAAEEREACEKACKQIGQHGIITQCVNAIRARGQA